MSPSAQAANEMVCESKYDVIIPTQLVRRHITYGSASHTVINKFGPQRLAISVCLTLHPIAAVSSYTSKIADGT